MSHEPKEKIRLQGRIFDIRAQHRCNTEPVGVDRRDRPAPGQGRVYRATWRSASLGKPLRIEIVLPSLMRPISGLP